MIYDTGTDARRYFLDGDANADYDAEKGLLYARIVALEAALLRYAPTDGDARSTDELLAQVDTDSDGMVTLWRDVPGAWVFSWYTPRNQTGHAPTARAALIEALKERTP